MKKNELLTLFELVSCRQAELIKGLKWNTDEYRSLERIKIWIKKRLKR